MSKKIAVLKPIGIIAVIILICAVLIKYITYTERYSYNLEEVELGVYAIHNTVSSNTPAHNYEVITICYDNQVHTFKGTASICYTDGKPCADITVRHHADYADKITIYVPKGSVKFEKGVGLK